MRGTISSIIVTKRFCFNKRTTNNNICNQMNTWIFNNNDNKEIESHKEQVLISSKRKKKKRMTLFLDLEIHWHSVFGVLNWVNGKYTHMKQFTWNLYNFFWRLQLIFYFCFCLVFGCRMKLSKSTFSLGSAGLYSFSYFSLNVGIHK